MTLLLGLTLLAFVTPAASTQTGSAQAQTTRCAPLVVGQQDLYCRALKTETVTSYRKYSAGLTAADTTKSALCLQGTASAQLTTPSGLSFRQPLAAQPGPFGVSARAGLTQNCASPDGTPGALK